MPEHIFIYFFLLFASNCLPTQSASFQLNPKTGAYQYSDGRTNIQQGGKGGGVQIQDVKSIKNKGDFNMSDMAPGTQIQGFYPRGMNFQMGTGPQIQGGLVAKGNNNINLSGGKNFQVTSKPPFFNRIAPSPAPVVTNNFYNSDDPKLTFSEIKEVSPGQFVKNNFYGAPNNSGVIRGPVSVHQDINSDESEDDATTSDGNNSGDSYETYEDATYSYEYSDDDYSEDSEQNNKKPLFSQQKVNLTPFLNKGNQLIKPTPLIEAKQLPNLKLTSLLGAKGPIPKPSPLISKTPQLLPQSPLNKPVVSLLKPTAAGSILQNTPNKLQDKNQKGYWKSDFPPINQCVKVNNLSGLKYPDMSNEARTTGMNRSETHQAYQCWDPTPAKKFYMLKTDLKITGKGSFSMDNARANYYTMDKKPYNYKRK